MNTTKTTIQSLRHTLEQIGVNSLGLAAAIMPKRIRTAMRETYFYGTSQPIRLAEVSIRDDDEHFRCVRMYLDIVSGASDRAFIPVICLGPRHVLTKLAAREGLRVQPYTGIIHIEGCEFLVLTNTLLQQLRGFQQILDQPDLVIVQRRSSFRLTGIQSCVVDGQAAVIKHYDNLVNPATGEFFIHILSHTEVLPLIGDSGVGEIPGICVTNSMWYCSAHPELDFVRL